MQRDRDVQRREVLLWDGTRASHTDEVFAVLNVS